MFASEITDALWAAIAPAAFVRKRACRIYRHQTELLLVGTLHWHHIGKVRLNIGFFQSLISFYGPAIIGIEARPQDLDQGLVGLAPIDMAFIWAIAQSTGQCVFGFDYWSEHEYEALALKHALPDFNSVQINAMMAESIERQIEPGRRHILFTGYSHVKPIRDRLLVRGFCLDPSFELEIERLVGDQHKEQALRPLLQPDFQRSIDHLDRYLQHLRDSHAGDKWVRRVRQKRNRLVQLLEMKAVED
jgi:hypothetical protein